MRKMDNKKHISFANLSLIVPYHVSKNSGAFRYHCQIIPGQVFLQNLAVIAMQENTKKLAYRKIAVNCNID